MAWHHGYPPKASEIGRTRSKSAHPRLQHTENSSHLPLYTLDKRIGSASSSRADRPHQMRYSNPAEYWTSTLRHDSGNPIHYEKKAADGRRYKNKPHHSGCDGKLPRVKFAGGRVDSNPRPGPGALYDRHGVSVKISSIKHDHALYLDAAHGGRGKDAPWKPSFKDKFATTLVTAQKMLGDRPETLDQWVLATEKGLHGSLRPPIMPRSSGHTQHGACAGCDQCRQRDLDRLYDKYERGQPVGRQHLAASVPRHERSRFRGKAVSDSAIFNGGLPTQNPGTMMGWTQPHSQSHFDICPDWPSEQHAYRRWEAMRRHSDMQKRLKQNHTF